MADRKNAPESMLLLSPVAGRVCVDKASALPPPVVVGPDPEAQLAWLASLLTAAPGNSMKEGEACVVAAGITMNGIIVCGQLLPLAKQ